MKIKKSAVAVGLTLAAVFVVAQPSSVLPKRNARQAAMRPQLQMQHLPRPDRFQPRGTLLSEDRAAIEDANTSAKAVTSTPSSSGSGSGS